MEMNVEMKFTKLANGFQCYYQHWFPENPKALLVMIHGVGDHAGRFNEFVSFLGCRGYACALYDQRGHGLSEGKRGHFSSFEQLLEDLDTFINFTQGIVGKELPLILVGGSLGGLVAFNYLVDHQEKAQGMIAASAAIYPTIPLKGWEKRVVRAVGKAFPSFTIHNKLLWDNMMNDPDEKKSLIDDKLFHRRISFGAAIEIEKRLEYVMTLPHRIYVPSLMLAGSGDQICASQGTRDFTDRLSSSEKECIIYDGMLHDILHDTGRKQVMEDVDGWLSKVTGGGKK